MRGSLAARTLTSRRLPCYAWNYDQIGRIDNRLVAGEGRREANPLDMQFIRDLREATGALKELVADDARHEEDAKLELTVSAQRFSQETREVVDDKLSFSATLMRAGEVDAATRLLAEVEAEVRDNEAALFEQVNEVKVAR